MKLLIVLAAALTLVSCKMNANPVLHISKGKIYGTGFVVHTTSLVPVRSIIITNQHVCATNYKEALATGMPFKYGPIKAGEYEAEILAVDKTNDLCVLSIAAHSKVVSLVSDSFVLYDWHKYSIMSIGSNNITIDYVGKDNITDRWTRTHQNSHSGLSYVGTLKFGMSGSPIINDQGKAVGVMWGISNNPKNVQQAFFIDVKQIRQLLKTVDIDV